MRANNLLETTSHVTGLRDANEVASLACMGAAHPHRLSYMRLLLRRMKKENWTFSRHIWELDHDGYGTAVYTARGPEHSYSLVAFSHYLDPEKRSDRVIATAWDATYTLFDGVPSSEDIARLRANVPLQEAGRVSAKELTVSRTNRSVRLFDHVVARLSAGHQPDENLIRQVGYLMRTTAVYGSGKLGAADYDSLRSRTELQSPFQAEMLTVFLIRQFTLDLVDHIAEARAPEAWAACFVGQRSAENSAWAIQPASEWHHIWSTIRCCSTPGFQSEKKLCRLCGPFGRRRLRRQHHSSR